MSFIESVKENFSLPTDFACSFYAVLIDDCGGYFQCVKKIENYSLDKIEFSIKNRIVVVKGERLCIKKFCKGDLVIWGKINTVERK